jgi:hypothetical protein
MKNKMSPAQIAALTKLSVRGPCLVATSTRGEYVGCAQVINLLRRGFIEEIVHAGGGRQASITGAGRLALMAHTLAENGLTPSKP